MVSGEAADLAVEALVRQLETKGNIEFFRDAIPAIESSLNFPYIIVAQAGIERRERGNSLLDDLSIDDFKRLKLFDSRRSSGRNSCHPQAVSKDLWVQIVVRRIRSAPVDFSRNAGLGIDQYQGAPDLAGVVQTNVQEDFDAGVMEPVEPYFSKWDQKDDYFPTIPDFMRSKNLPVPEWIEKRSKIEPPFEKV